MENKDKIILHLCADIGSDSKPYRDNGYDVRCIGKDIGVENYHPPENVYGIIANPPCTMFSWARTNAKKARSLEEGMFLVKECLRIIWECQYRIKNDNQKTFPLKFWCLENPYFGFLRAFLGTPTFVYSPEEYGDCYQKRTALWGLFNAPPKNPVLLSEEAKAKAKTKTKTNSYLHTRKFDMMLSKDIHPEKFGVLNRQARRSICSEKFAQAFFNVNR